MQTEGRPASGPLTQVLYVYYRVEAADRADCVAAVRSAQAALMQRHPGLVAAVLSQVPGHTTLMETYAWSSAAPAVPPAWSALEAEVGARLGRWIVGTRHLELFEPCA